MPNRMTARYQYAGDHQWTVDVFQRGLYHDGARADSLFALFAWLAARYPDAVVEG